MRKSILAVATVCAAGVVLWHRPAAADLVSTFEQQAHDACVAAMTDPAANAFVDPTLFIANCIDDVRLTGILLFVDGQRTLYFSTVHRLASTCPSAPLTGCRAPGGSAFGVGRNAKPAKNKLTWVWRKGEALTAVDLGDPRTDTDYLLCVYADGGLLFQTTAPAGSLWKAAGGSPPKAFTYKDKLAANDGLKKIGVHAGVGGKAKALLKGGGTAIPAVTLPLNATSIVVQLVSSHLPRQCLSAAYASPFKHNTDKAFLAQLP